MLDEIPINLMLPSILDFAMARCSISSAVSSPSFSNAVEIQKTHFHTAFFIMPLAATHAENAGNTTATEKTKIDGTTHCLQK